MLNRVILILLFPLLATYGNINISGAVRDANSGEPIELVNIWDSVAGKGTTTNESGLFTLNAGNQEYMDLSFTHIAYDFYFQSHFESLVKQLYN